MVNESVTLPDAGSILENAYELHGKATVVVERTSKTASASLQAKRKFAPVVFCEVQEKIIGSPDTIVVF